MRRSPSQPGNTNLIAKAETGNARPKALDATNNFMTGNQRQYGVRQFTVDDMQICPTHAASLNAQPDLVFPRVRCIEFDRAKGSADLLENHGAHFGSYTPGWGDLTNSTEQVSELTRS